MPARDQREVLLFAALTAVALWAPSARAECNEAISPETAQKVFESLKGFKGADGCTLENIKTDKEIMLVEWTKAGKQLPAIEVRPASCSKEPVIAGAKLAMSAPAAVTEQCPAALERMKSLVASESAPVGELVKTTPPPPLAAARRVLPLVALGALLAIAGAVVIWKKQRKTPTPAATAPPDPPAPPAAGDDQAGG